MQDKIKKILNIKIDAINQNIENLNYLNEELEKNNSSLDYIKENIALFKNNEILNFDKISKEDFDKILLMIDPSISDVFRDKSCSYDGIIYIIEGIRKSINLELTEQQTNAILTFVEGLRMKSVNLQDVIANLTENKDHLPETNLDNLKVTLNNYQDIVSKFDSNLYLTEIDEIENALDFAGASLEEKVDIFEYILKYNAEIYSSKQENVENKDVDIDGNYSFDLPTFHYEPVDLTTESEEPSKFENEEIEEDKKVDEYEDEDYKLDLNQMLEPLSPDEKEALDKEEVVNQDIDTSFNNITFPTIDIFDKPNNEEIEEHQEIPVEIPDNFDETSSQEESHELNTVELEDIIKKIDARLKEMDNEETNSMMIDNTQSEINPIEDVKIDYSELLDKYALSDFNIKNNSKENVEAIIEVLNQYNVLDDLKKNKDVLSDILSFGDKEKIEEIVSIIKENLLVKKDEFEYVFEIVLKTMPIIFINDDAYNSFKANIEFFKDKKINIINLFDNYRELLIINNEILKDNYRKVELYGLEVNNDTVKYYLYNKNVLSNIDSYIEAVGYEKGFLGKEDRFDGIDYIKKNPYKLNEITKDTLMKLRFASENNEKIYGNKPGILSGEISNPKVDVLSLSEEYKNEYFNGQYSFIDNSEYLSLKEEIDNMSNFDITIDENINKLDSNYKNGELRYKFGNTLVSRIKTIRIYNFLKTKNIPLKNSLIIALTFNTVLKINEYEEIEKIINNIVEGGN